MRVGDRDKLGRKRNGGKERARKRKRKAAEKSEARRRTGQAIRSRAGCVEKKNWKSVALDGPDDLRREGSKRGNSGVS